MSVVSQLKAYRYTAADALGHSGEIHWRALRSIDVAALRVEEPDLLLMKNLLSTLATSSMTVSMVKGATDADLLQLLQLLQASLQFALHSQEVLKGQLVARQNDEAVQRVSSKYVERLDATVAVLKHDVAALTEERDALKLSAETLRRSVAEQSATVRTLESQLAKERERFYQAMTQQEKLLQLARSSTDGRLPPPLPAATTSWGAGGGSACPTCGGPLHRAADPALISNPSPPPPEGHSSSTRRRHRKSRKRHPAPSDVTSLTSSLPSTTGTETAEELRALERRHARRTRSRQRALAKTDDYVDWRTFSQLVTALHGRGASRHLDSGEMLYQSEHSIPVDVPTRRTDSDAGYRRGTPPPPPSLHQQQQLQRSAPTADALQGIVADAMQVLQGDLRQQLSSVVQAVEATTGRLSSDLSQLRANQQRLETAFATQQQQQHYHPQPQPHPVAVVAAPVTTPPPPLATAHEGVTRQQAKTATKTAPPPQQQQQRQPVAHSSAPPDLPRRPPVVQESVTPLTASPLPLTSFDPVLAPPPQPTDSSASGPAEAADRDPPQEHKAAALSVNSNSRSGAPASVPLTAKALAEHTAPAAAGRKAPVRTAEVTKAPPAAPAGKKQQQQQQQPVEATPAEKRAANAPPSLQSSSLTVKSRSTLPDFDVSLLRTPPKDGKGKAAPAERPGSARSAPAARKQWHDTPNEEQPAGVAARAKLSSPLEPTPASSSLPFNPRDSETSGAAGKPAVGGGARGAGKDDGPRKACEHCHRRFAPAEHAAHERGCDLRLIPCPSCGKRIVSRLMAKHVCADTKEARAGSAAASAAANDSLEHSRVSSQAGSLGPKRASSLLLLEAQRELQSLMEEEEAYQRSRTQAS